MLAFKRLNTQENDRNEFAYQPYRAQGAFVCGARLCRLRKCQNDGITANGLKTKGKR